MKVAFITPCYLQDTRGNAVTVRRIEGHLRAAGCTVRVFSREEYGDDLLRGIRAFGPDLVHAFHALQCGGAARLIAAALDIPYLITFTGTDLYAGRAADGGSDLAELLAAAAALVVFHEGARQRLHRLLPHLLTPVAVIPQGVGLPPTVPPEPAGDVVFLLPAGIRPVKNVMFPVAPLDRLHASHPGLRLRLEVVGPVLDAAYAGEFFSAIDRSPHAEWLGELPFEAMPGLYARSHVVLNTSLSEGMANSLLEAMAFGRPVLAADIEGNRSLVRDGVNGLLYGSEDDFLGKAELLLASPELRRRLGRAGREHVEAHCSPEREAEAYLKLYASLT